MKTKCLCCESEIGAKAGTLNGEVIQCSGCGENFEVVQAEPLQIAEMPEVEEDWGE